MESSTYIISFYLDLTFMLLHNKIYWFINWWQFFSLDIRWMTKSNPYLLHWYQWTHHIAYQVQVRMGFQQCMVFQFTQDQAVDTQIDLTEINEIDHYISQHHNHLYTHTNLTLRAQEVRVLNTPNTPMEGW